MKKAISYFNWQRDLDFSGVASIDHDFILFEGKPFIPSDFHFPFRVDATTAIVGVKGIAQGIIDLKPYYHKTPCLTILLPGQILQHKDIENDDFEGLYIVMSQKFFEGLFDMQEKMSLLLSIQKFPSILLTQENLKNLIEHYNMVKKVVLKKDNPYRLEVVRLLTKAFFYNTAYQFHQKPETQKVSKQEILVQTFWESIKLHFKEERKLEFYADKLCLTPKHLSKVVKETTGISASQWIDNYVILEAKVSLKSTNLTIQQISDILNFPSQSFFGKYFKRQVGLSPKEYRNQ